MNSWNWNLKLNHLAESRVGGFCISDSESSLPGSRNFGLQSHSHLLTWLKKIIHLDLVVLDVLRFKM